MFNKVVLIGNLTKDPEIRYTKNGSAICTITLANNRKYKDKEEVLFVDAVAFGKTAENINRFFEKGNPILIEGRLVLDRWEKDGKKYSKHKINIERFEFIGYKTKEKEMSKTSSSFTAKKEGNTVPEIDIDDEEIPF